MQFIPARGRKHLHYFPVSAQYYCNLSPRGDGNPVSIAPALSMIAIAIYPREGTETRNPRLLKYRIRIAIYPREGTETLLLFSMVFPFLIAIYPREGTETRRGWTGRAGRRRLQFIPARGRKHLAGYLARHGVEIAIYPREGTETFPIFAIVKTFFHCNLSPRGDGNKTKQLFSTCAGYCNLSPRGDGNSQLSTVGKLWDYCNLSPRGDGNILLLTWKENRSIIDLSL